MTEILSHRISLSIAAETQQHRPSATRSEWILQVPPIPVGIVNRPASISFLGSSNQQTIIPNSASLFPKSSTLPNCLSHLEPALTRPPSSRLQTSAIINQPSSLELDPPDIQLVRIPFPDQPKPPSRAAKLFWWGFSFPPLWIMGTFHFHPAFRPRPCPLTTTSRTGHPSLRSRLKARLGRGEVGAGNTALVIIPGPLSDEKVLREPSSHQWNSLCESPAERFLGEEGQSQARLEWLVSGHQNSVIKVEQNRLERKWAFRCLLALVMTAGLIVIILVVSHHVQKRSTRSFSGQGSDSGTGSASGTGNTSPGPAASRSNRPI